MPQPLVGIIANPASGRDIRRLVAHGTVFDNNEKTAIVRRVLMGLEAVGITRVAYMPEHDFGIVPRTLTEQMNLVAEPLNIPVLGTSADSTYAAQLLVQQGARCIITLGGDGTNRAVAKGSATIPLVPISTGTNNVFPTFLEGTLAGLAAGLIVQQDQWDNNEHMTRMTRRVPWLEVQVDQKPQEHALIDAVISTLPFVGSRALWDLSAAREILLSRVIPATIGISALGGALLDHNIAAEQLPGMHITLGEGGRQVLATLAPGLVQWIGITNYRRLALDDVVQFQPGIGTVALDGEREIELSPSSLVTVRLCANGPVVVDVPAVLEAAARNGKLYR